MHSERLDSGADRADCKEAEGLAGPLKGLAVGRAKLTAGDVAGALETLREVCAQAPGIAEGAIALGEALLVADHLPAAIAEFNRALRLAPGLLRAQIALGRAWLAAGEGERALEALSAVDATDVSLAAEVSKLTAEARAILRADRAAPGYVRHLFDQFAPDYDTRMQGALSYRAPEILRGLADMVMGARSRPFDILDLGCGTGLSGARFADLAGRLDGIDLSPRMIAYARERGIYRDLVLGDLETELLGGGRSYDLVIAADTLVYFGNLVNVLRGVRMRLNPGGFFLFSVEEGPGVDYELGPKRRYRHSEAYLRREAASAGFEVMGLLACSPRDEAKEPVSGLAVALQSI